MTTDHGRGAGAVARIEGSSVLVVDDDPTIRDVLVRYLDRAGFEPSEAADGETARRRLRAQPPDLVVLDLMLPEVDGLELCRWIRQQSATPDLPVILLTARGEESDRIVGLELGADDYVVKPFSPRELVERVKAVLRRTGRERDRPRRLTYGDLEIDSAVREVTRSGRVLPLTATEFDLLWCLASHPRVAFSREQLMATVWGYQAALDAGTATVTVHIRRLREKVEDDASKPRWITTVWGVGYRFEPC